MQALAHGMLLLADACWRARPRRATAHRRPRHRLYRCTRTRLALEAERSHDRFGCPLADDVDVS